jgi:hypothetical protein
MTLPKYFIFALLFMLIVPLLSGCSAGTVIGKSADFAVSKYCEVPEAGRNAVRQVVSRAVHPNTIRITCADD